MILTNEPLTKYIPDWILAADPERQAFCAIVEAIDDPLFNVVLPYVTGSSNKINSESSKKSKDPLGPVERYFTYNVGSDEIDVEALI